MLLVVFVSLFAVLVTMGIFSITIAMLAKSAVFLVSTTNHIATPANLMEAMITSSPKLPTAV
jgi:hypothetical protein